MPPAAVGLVLSDPVPQGLRMHAQLLGQPPDHRLRVRLPVQAHCPFPQLVRVLLRCCHDDFLPRLTRSNLVWKSPGNRGRLTAGYVAIAVVVVWWIYQSRHGDLVGALALLPFAGFGIWRGSITLRRLIRPRHDVREPRP
jgi:hypothetical protein